MSPANLARAGSSKRGGGGLLAKAADPLSVAAEEVSLLNSPSVAQSLGALKRDGLLVTVTRKEALLKKAKRAETRDAVRKQTEICKLYPPAMAGELSLLDPWNGVEQATVVADTYVEMLVLNKKQIDHRKFSKHDIIRVDVSCIGNVNCVLDRRAETLHPTPELLARANQLPQ